MSAEGKNPLDVQEYLFKVVVIGDAGVGKTSLIKRYVHGEYGNKYKYTIGVDFALKQVDWKDDAIVRLQLWDIAGQERFGIMTHVYYKEAVAALIVFDLTNPKTFQAIRRWKMDVDAKVFLPNGAPVPCILLANKCDMDRAVSSEEVSGAVSEMGFTGMYETSAKSNTNIDSAMKFLIDQIINAMKGKLQFPASPQGSFRLGGKTNGHVDFMSGNYGSQSPSPSSEGSCCFGGRKSSG